MSKNVAIVQSYFNAVATGDLETLENLLAADIIWHQPGKGIQSGVYKGKPSLFTHLGNLMKWSKGTFAIDAIGYITDNGNLVTAAIHFKAEKGDCKLSMNGVDVLRIEMDKIAEVWLFSEKIEQEDVFWNQVAKE